MEKKVKESDRKQKTELTSEERKKKNGGKLKSLYLDNYIVVYCPECNHIVAHMADLGNGINCPTNLPCHNCGKGLTLLERFTTSEFTAKFGFAP